MSRKSQPWKEARCFPLIFHVPHAVSVIVSHSARVWSLLLTAICSRGQTHSAVQAGSRCLAMKRAKRDFGCRWWVPRGLLVDQLLQKQSRENNCVSFFFFGDPMGLAYSTTSSDTGSFQASDRRTARGSSAQVRSLHIIACWKAGHAAFVHISVGKTKQGPTIGSDSPAMAGPVWGKKKKKVLKWK